LAVASLYTVVGGQVAQPDSAITRKAAAAVERFLRPRELKNTALRALDTTTLSALPDLIFG
jgi:hypothetical protein